MSGVGPDAEELNSVLVLEQEVLYLLSHLPNPFLSPCYRSQKPKKVLYIQIRGDQIETRKQSKMHIPASA